MPELMDITITNINTNGEPIKTNHRTCSSNVLPTHKLVNNELIDNNELSCNEVSSARIIVNGLTASWTHVNTCNNI